MWFVEDENEAGDGSSRRRVHKSTLFEIHQLYANHRTLWFHHTKHNINDGQSNEHSTAKYSVKMFHSN